MRYPPSPSPDMEPRVPDSFDPRTTSVSPSAPHPLTLATDTPDSGTTSGRGNSSDRSSGPNVPPRIVGLSLPPPHQLTGSNQPGSGIKQLPGATSQQPGQMVPLPPVESGTRIVIPKNADPFLEQTGTTPGRGNPYGPFGRISPRTAAGNDADPLPGEPMPPSTSVIKQKQNPTEPRQ